MPNLKYPNVLLTVLLCVAHAVPVAAQDRPYRIGWVQYTPRNVSSEDLLKSELRKLGYIEGTNITYRSMEGRRDWADTRQKTADLLAWQPDVIVTTASNAALIAQEMTMETRTPVVFWATDGHAEGLVDSNRRPGGNMTGFSFEPYNQFLEMRFLKLAIPNLKCVAHLYNPTYAPAAGTLEQLRAAGEVMSMPVAVYEVLGKEQFAPALAAMKADGCIGVVIGPHELFNTNGEVLGPLFLKYGLATVGVQTSIVRAGGLASYSPPRAELYYPQFARTIDRILKGADPAEIPMQRNFKSTVLLNLKSARALGLTLPDDLIDEADEIISE